MSLLTTLESFNTCFEKLEENLQAMTEAGDIDTTPNKSINDKDIPYSPSISNELDFTNVIDKCGYVQSPSSFVDKLNSLADFSRLVIDSSALKHMSSVKELFEFITPFPSNNAPLDLMGDEQTLRPVSGFGFVNYIVHGH